MTSNVERVLIARWILPIVGPPINGGYLRMVDDRVVELGTLSSLKSPTSAAVDLGDVAVFPKPVNAHTHLEFSDCDTPIGEPGIELADWISQVITTRGQVSVARRQHNIALGIEETARCQVALVGDIATPPSTYEATVHGEACSTPAIVSFAEVLGMTAERAEERFASANAHVTAIASDRLPRQTLLPAISAHAPYSTPLEWIDRCVDHAHLQKIPLAIHLAESPAERRLLENGDGPLAEFLKRAGLWRGDRFPFQADKPFQRLIERVGRAPRALLVHGNDLNAEEIKSIAEQKHVSVVFCPRTHHFFRHRPYPLAEMINAGVRVALGTDSRASNPDLNVWREFRFVLAHHSDVNPEEILRMVTCHGADALLGNHRFFGSISPGDCQLGRLAKVTTTADSPDRLWSDLAASDLMCIEPPQRP
jgi:cytosine/adenosine deaminase-related metal-dependent hydrolase